MKKMILEKGEYEKSHEYIGRLLASMFQEVYAHTGREMPFEMFDRCSDLGSEIRDVIAEEVREMKLR